MAREIKIGDVVRLKSGGPDMTVYEIQPELRLANCMWFNGGLVPNRDTVVLACLKHPEGPDQTEPTEGVCLPRWIGDIIEKAVKEIKASK